MPTESTAQRLLPHLRRIARAREAESTDGQLLGAFVAERDGDAFAALVRRHGPMVLGVCRRVIGDVHLAEDAFQATFLVLARRAAVVRPRHLVGPWLYGVAYRTALKARGSAARRKAKEKQVDAMPQPAFSPDEAWADLQPVLDAELARLPDKYRIPIVLCDLGGRPQRDVARELKLPAATLANRLASARRLLAKRLTDRGVVLSAGAVASALGWHSATSAVPPNLVHTAVQAAQAAATGGVVGLPAPVLKLSEGMMRMFVLKKLKAIAVGTATSLVLLAGLGLATGPTLRANPEDKPVRAPKNNPPRKSSTAESDDAQFLRRRSLDLRGTLPSTLEFHYFLTDTDANKRQKVTEWMLPEHAKQPVRKSCASCHDGLAMADFDRDGYPDLLITGKWSNASNDPNTSADFVSSYLRPSHEQKEVDQAKARVEQAKAMLEAARADVQHAAAIAQKLKHDKEGQKIVDLANARLVQKNAELKVAQAQLDSAEKAKRAAVLKWAHPNHAAETIDQRLAKSWVQLSRTLEPSDAEFLRRASLDVRGVPPTKVEENYFVADKDPKKREKLLKMLIGSAQSATAREKFVESLLADPGVQSRWVELWKQRIIAERQRERERASLEAWIKSPHDRLERLLMEMIENKKSDDQILDALCLATMARFPTATEKKLILEGLKVQPDRRAAWPGVLRALSTTNEAKAHAAALAKRSGN